MLTDAIRLLVFPALMAFAASSDLFTMTISNRVTLALVGGFVAMAFIGGMSPSDVLAHTGAAATVLAVTFLFFARGWIGGGDAKLAAATALWLGFDHLLNYVLYASIFGGILTFAVSEGIIRRLSDDLARNASPHVYGATGRTTAPDPKRGQPLAFSRTL